MPLSLSGTTGIVSANIQDGAIQTVDIANGAVTAAKLGGTNTVLQVVSISNTTPGGNGGFSTTSTSYVDITGLSLNITPSAATSKILVLVSITGFGAIYSGAKIVRVISGSPTDIGVTPAYGSNRVAAGIGLTSTSGGKNPSQILLDTPNTTSQITYKVQVRTNQTYSGTFILNENSNDGDVAYNFTGSSHITAMEISA